MFKPHRHETGIVRREFLQVGFSGFLGVGLSNLIAARAAQAATAANPPKAKSMILVFLTGAASHIDTFDMKPDAPTGIRGEFQSIATNAPGVRYCEHLPRLAKLADKLAVVRSMSHAHTNHLNATHWLLTGHSQPGAFFDKIASRDDYPCYASALDYVRPRADGIPSGVMLPTFLMEGPLVWPVPATRGSSGHGTTPGRSAKTRTKPRVQGRGAGDPCWVQRRTPPGPARPARADELSARGPRIEHST